MQEGYLRKIMDIDDPSIIEGIIAMFKKFKGDSAFFDLICSEVGDEGLAAYYYLRLTDSTIKRGEIFLNAIIGLMSKREGDKRLIDFLDAGFGKEEIVEYYIRHKKIEKVWELLT